MGCAKAVLRGKFISNKCLHWEEKSQINNLILCPKELENKEHTEPSVLRRKIIKIITEINEKENRKTIEKIMQTKGWFFENIFKKLTRWAKKKKENTNQQIYKWKRRRYKWYHRNIKAS